MSYDFSAADAELSELGSVPDNLKEIVEWYAGDLLGDEAALDAALDELGEVPPNLSDAIDFPETSGASGERQSPKSGEISLPASAAQERGAEGFGSEQSGSFQVPEGLQDAAAEDPSGAMQTAMSSQLADDDAAEDDGPRTDQVSLDGLLTDEEGLPALFASEDAPETTQVVTTAAAQAAIEAEAREQEQDDATLVQPADPSVVSAPDPADLEFDAMFDGLTSQSVPPAASERPVLRESDRTQLDPEGGPLQVPNDDLELDFGRDDDEDTQLFDSAGFAGVAASMRQSRDTQVDTEGDESEIEELDLEELSADDLELVMDDEGGEDGETGQGVEPPPRPGPGAAKAGLLGKFLGRKDKDK